MRVALVVERLEIGGLPNYVLALARLLAEAKCTVVVAHGNMPLPSHLETDGLTTLWLPGLTPGAGRSASVQAAVSLLDWAPDVIHVHLCSSVRTIERLLASNVPLVRSFHDLTSLCLRLGRRRWPGDRCQRALHWSCIGWGCMLSPPREGRRLPHVADLQIKLAERDCYRAFGMSIACSTFMARTLRLNGFDEARICVVPNFSRFDSSAEGSDPMPKKAGLAGRDRPVELLFAGQAVGGKGLEVLIAALTGIVSDWRLTVLAEGPRLAPARALAARSGLEGKINFAGWVPQTETQNRYKSADLLVMPSIIDEALPLVGIEAMSFATPLVGFAVGGIPDYLLDDETGILVHEVTAGGLRAGLERAFASADRIADWGLNARHLVATRHTRAAHIAAIRDVYRAAGCRADFCLTGGERFESVHS